MRSTAENSCVYFVAPIGGGRVKIGRSREPLDRLASLLLWSPVELEILATALGGFDEETAVHYRFRHLYVRREWFEPAPELLDFVALVKSTGALPHDDTPRKLMRAWRYGFYSGGRTRSIEERRAQTANAVKAHQKRRALAKKRRAA